MRTSLKALARGQRGRPARRARVVAILCTVLLAGVTAGISAAPALANSSSYWNGVQFGWTNDHGWAIASNATVARVGSGQIASLVCDAVSRNTGAGSICGYAVSTMVGSLVAGQPWWTTHGVWVAMYPWQWGRVTGGRY